MMQPRTTGRRRAFTLLELLVAFVVLAIAITGMIPLVIMQSRQISRMESRFNAATTYYLVPSTDDWAEKLGAADLMQSTEPDPIPAAAVLLIDNGDAQYM